MINRHRVIWACLLVYCMSAGLARGQAPAGGLASLKTAAAIDPAGEKAISAAVAAYFKGILNPDPRVQADARDAAINDSRAGATDATPAYANAYATAISNEAINALKIMDVRSQLNTAIVVARVAEASKSTRLEPVVQQMLDPKQSVAVQLWGLKAARAILPELVKINAAKEILARIPALIASRPDGMLSEDAYAALRVTNPQAMDAMLSVLQTRLGKYKTGIPDDPSVEAVAYTYLTQPAVWTSLNQDQKVQVMQLICNTLAWAADRGDNFVQPQSTERDQVRAVIGNIGGALFVAASQMQEQGLATVGRDINRRANGNERLTAIVAPACSEIRKAKGFEKVQEPKIEPAASAASNQ